MNSWPARWAAVIREKTRAAQESGWGACGDGDACVAAARAEPTAAVEAPETEEPPEVGSHPAQAKASERTPPIRAPATWCLTMPPDFLWVTLPASHGITGRFDQCRIAETRSLICSTVASNDAVELVALARRASMRRMLSALGLRL